MDRKNPENLDIWITSAFKDFLNDIDKLPKNLDPWETFSSSDWQKIRLKAKVLSRIFAALLLN